LKTAAAEVDDVFETAAVNVVAEGDDVDNNDEDDDPGFAFCRTSRAFFASRDMGAFLACS
jgi:hypothetical protein